MPGARGAAASDIPLPFLTPTPGIARRDPAVVHDAGVFHCFHTVVRLDVEPPELWVEVTTSGDLRTWSPPRRVTPRGENFSSPGSVVRVGDEWVMALQSYPIEPGEHYGSARSALWLARSTGLVSWQEPERVVVAGEQHPPRRIDPFLLAVDDGYVCLYKTGGQLHALTSPDLEQWRDVGLVLGTDDVPDSATLENPAVVRLEDGGYRLFFSPCRPERGVGVADGADPLHWRDARYLDVPTPGWAIGGITGAFALPTPDLAHAWALFAHGDTAGAHGGELVLFVGDTLESWRAEEPVPLT